MQCIKFKIKYAVCLLNDFTFKIYLHKSNSLFILLFKIWCSFCMCDRVLVIYSNSKYQKSNKKI